MPIGKGLSMSALIVAGVGSEQKFSVSTICAVPVFGATAFFCFSFQDRTKHTTFASEFRSNRLIPEKTLDKNRK
jgi:hypothetical protein